MRSSLCATGAHFFPLCVHHFSPPGAPTFTHRRVVFKSVFFFLRKHGDEVLCTGGIEVAF